MTIKETLLKLCELISELDSLAFDEGELSPEFFALLTHAPESEQAAELDKVKQENFLLRRRISHLENENKQLNGTRIRLKKKHKRVCEANRNLGNYVRRLEIEKEELEKYIAAMEEDCCC